MTPSRKWKGITTAKLLPTSISDAVQTMLRKSGLNLVWESKVKGQEALKELKITMKILQKKSI